MGWFDWFKSKKKEVVALEKEIPVQSPEKKKPAPESIPEQNSRYAEDIKLSLRKAIQHSKYEFSLTTGISVKFFYYTHGGYCSVNHCMLVPKVPLDELTPPEPTYVVGRDGTFVLVDKNNNWVYTEHTHWSDEPNKLPHYELSALYGFSKHIKHGYGEPHYSDIFGSYSKEWRATHLNPHKLGVISELDSFCSSMTASLEEPYDDFKTYGTTLSKAIDAVDTLGDVVGLVHESNYLPKLKNDKIVVFNGTEMIRSQITGWCYIPPKGDMPSRVDIFILNQPLSFYQRFMDLPEITTHLQPVSDVKENYREIQLKEAYASDVPDLEAFCTSPEELMRDKLKAVNINKTIADVIDNHYIEHYGMPYLEVLNDTFDIVLPNINVNQ